MKKRSFTLIELLVVIAIIVILAAILLPALNKARDRAKAIKCTGNFKQIGMGTLSYAAARGDFCTPASLSTWNSVSNMENNWIVLMWPYLYNSQYPNNNRSVNQPTICPGAEPLDLQYHNGTRPITNLAWNNRAGNSSYPKRKISRCRFPSQQALMWDVLRINRQNKSAYTITTFGRDYHSSTVTLEWSPMRHSNMDNHLFVDGHVKALNNTILGPNHSRTFVLTSTQFWP